MTDITGFGLLGHACEMAQAGKVNFRFAIDRLAWLPGAIEYGQADIFPGGTAVNRQHFAPSVTFADSVNPVLQNLLWTPETSGGLLVALAAETVATYQAHCPSAIIVGEVVAGNGSLEVG